MRLLYGFIAGAADLATDGLFSVIRGGIEVLKLVPAGSKADGRKAGKTFPTLALVARIECDPPEFDQEFELSVERIAPDAGRIELGKLKVTVQPREGLPLVPNTVGVCIETANMTFPVSGIYEFRFNANGTVLGALPLIVVGPATEEGHNGNHS